MEKIFYRFLAEVVFVFHILIVLVILFGWFFPHLFYIYGFLLFSTLFSWLVFGHCFLVDLEFYFRSKFNPSLKISSGFLAYYGQVLLKDKAPRESLIYYLGIIFLVPSILIWVFNFIN